MKRYQSRIPEVRVVRERTVSIDAAVVNEPAAVAALLGEKAETAITESMHVLALDRRNRVIALQEVAKGGPAGCAVNRADLFRLAVAVGANAIVLSHNHPSGDPTPSREDHAMTDAAREAGRVLGITVLDHVVVCSRTSFVSMGPWS